MHKTTVIQRALISVTDKTGIVELAQALHNKGVEILSTGGTAQQLRDHQIPVVDISQYTGYPEMMDGRLKTLHPKIYGGILGRRDTDLDIMSQHGIQDIDLVVVNLYQFQKAVTQNNVLLSDAIEKIDIGGPTLIRAAAKNFSWCTVVTDIKDYNHIIEELDSHNGIQETTRFAMAQKAFQYTAQYDGHIANYLSKLDSTDSSANIFGQTLNTQYQLKQVLRYGENPHQQAAFYQSEQSPEHCFAHAKQLQGKALSYNNILDGEAALKCVRRFDTPSCVIVKHTNPCGVAQSDTLSNAYAKAYQCDPQSAFGGIIAFNQKVDAKLIDTILSQQFVEVMIAPEFDPAALEVAKSKPNCRLMQYEKNNTLDTQVKKQHWETKSIEGGLLIQSPATQSSMTLEVVTDIQPSAAQLADLKFSWDVIQSVKSNAIVLAKNLTSIGIGAGQSSRVFSIKIAQMRAEQANLDLTGSVMASDAFFPFPDSVELAHELGITAIIQPGGSKKDMEVIKRANELGISMVFTHIRQFLH